MKRKANNWKSLLLALLLTGVVPSLQAQRFPGMGGTGGNRPGNNNWGNNNNRPGNNNWGNNRPGNNNMFGGGGNNRPGNNNMFGGGGNNRPGNNNMFGGQQGGGQQGGGQQGGGQQGGGQQGGGQQGGTNNGGTNTNTRLFNNNGYVRGVATWNLSAPTFSSRTVQTLSMPLRGYTGGSNRWIQARWTRLATTRMRTMPPQPGGAQPGGAQPGGAQPGGAQPGGAQPIGMGGMGPGGMGGAMANAANGAGQRPNTTLSGGRSVTSNPAIVTAFNRGLTGSNSRGHAANRAALGPIRRNLRMWRQ